jgi:hypothetical protein
MDQKDQTNNSTDNSDRDMFDILAEHRKRQEVEAYAAATAAESCAKQPYAPHSTTSPMQTDSAMSVDDALKMCEERDKKFEELYRYMPTDHIYKYLNTIHNITAGDRKILLMTLQTFEVMPKDIHNWKVRQGESKIVNRVAGFQLPCFREMGETEALQDFLDRLENYFLVNGVIEGAKLSTMLNAIPDKTLRGVVVRRMNSNLTYEETKKDMISRFGLGWRHWRKMSKELHIGKGTARAWANEYTSLVVRWSQPWTTTRADLSTWFAIDRLIEELHEGLQEYAL